MGIGGFHYAFLVRKVARHPAELKQNRSKGALTFLQVNGHQAHWGRLVSIVMYSSIAVVTPPILGGG